MIQDIKNTITGKNAAGALYLAGLAFIAADVIPTPADAVYFWLQEQNKNKLEAGHITASQYWTRDALLYYSLNPLWWALVFSVLVLTQGDITQKSKYALALIGSGAVVGVLCKNIQKDRRQSLILQP